MLIPKSGYNARYCHTMVDEDIMKYVKSALMKVIEHQQDLSCPGIPLPWNLLTSKVLPGILTNLHSANLC